MTMINDANTKKSAQAAFRTKLIDGKTLTRLTDGTVSKYDVAEAKQLVNEMRLSYNEMKNNPDDYSATDKTEAKDKYNLAMRLQSAIKTQYNKQGYIETSAENWTDWDAGSDWNRPR